jgi:hypothetical protein
MVAEDALPIGLGRRHGWIPACAGMTSGARHDAAARPGVHRAPSSVAHVLRDHALERLGERAGDVEARLLGNLDEAGRAGDVDLGEVRADDVEADDEEAGIPQLRRQRLGDLAVALGQRPRASASSSRYVE